MSESLFLLLCAACLYCARTERWTLGCALGGLAAFTRWFVRVLGALLTAVLVQLTGTLTTITVQQTLYGKQKDGQTS